MATPSGTRRQRLRSLRFQGLRSIDALDHDFCDAEGQPLDLIVMAAEVRRDALAAVMAACAGALAAG